MTIPSLHIAEEALNQIPDPDIPVISIVELGIVRNVEIVERKVVVSITPTYSGCPAMYFFKDEIPKKLHEAGFSDVEVKVVLSPPWTTDWLNDQTKEKLKAHGIAPPMGEAADLHPKRKVKCPRCGSSHTELRSQFGSTPCKALWFCDECSQPFEYFKCY